MTKPSDKLRRFGDIPIKQQGIVAVGQIKAFRAAIDAAAKAQADSMQAGMWMSRHGLTIDMLKTMTVVELARYLDMMGRDDMVPAAVLRTLARLK